MTRDQIRRFFTQTANVLDGLPFMYNTAMFFMFVWGVYALVGDEPPTAVSEETSHAAYQLWLLWHVLAPPAIWAGQLILGMRKTQQWDKIHATQRWRQRQKIAWPLRCSGDLALCVMLGTHFLALQQQADPSTLYWQFLIFGIALGMLGLSIRDLIRSVFAFCLA